MHNSGGAKRHDFPVSDVSSIFTKSATQTKISKVQEISAFVASPQRSLASTFSLGFHALNFVVCRERVRRGGFEMGVSPTLSGDQDSIFRVGLPNVKTSLHSTSCQLSKDSRHDDAAAFSALPIPTRIRIGTRYIFGTTSEGSVHVVGIHCLEKRL